MFPLALLVTGFRDTTERAARSLNKDLLSVENLLYDERLL